MGGEVENQGTAAGDWMLDKEEVEFGHMESGGGGEFKYDILCTFCK
jgi:hypothetical protein